MLFFNQKWQKCQSDDQMHQHMQGIRLKTILNPFFGFWNQPLPFPPIKTPKCHVFTENDSYSDSSSQGQNRKHFRKCFRFWILNLSLLVRTIEIWSRYVRAKTVPHRDWSFWGKVDWKSTFSFFFFGKFFSKI